ncbi:MAG TPA: hypothetical protein VMR25_19860 [Planctomycetaceae bacterium]|jgi:hypothetical protein|nr:hypothetical protein [Planctomycetaceae bacterium]
MARLFVIPARDEPVAVILRRGASRWYHVIQWNTRSDTFIHGAWIKARIYEEKCDISPDGRLFVYFVHQGSRIGTEFTDAWTAVSRVPWLSALAVWPEGTTYGGGGRFLDDRRLVVRSAGEGKAFIPHSDAPVRGLEISVDDPAELHSSDGQIGGADWSGRDHRGDVIFTRGGQLFRRQSTDDVLVADFTQLEPDPQPAPEWATRPL